VGRSGVTATDSGAAKVRRRRSSGQLRGAVLGAARELFSARGYSNTGIREVALEAGATEAAVYRHFGSKRGLFEAAVSEPYESFFTDYMDAWRRRGAPSALSNQEVVEGFIGGLYDLFQEHRSLILAYLAFQRFESDAASVRSPAGGLHAQLEPVGGWVRREQEARGFLDLDVPVTLRACVGMTMSMVLLDGMLFGARVPSRQRVIREVTSLIRRGVESRRL
jgi:AcrR family transcriptional regulator